MKNPIFLVALLTLVSNQIISQNRDIRDFFSIKPSDITLEKSETQQYDVTLKWQNLDAISGSKINCNIVKGNYIVKPGNEFVEWRDVKLAQVDNFLQTEFKATNLPSFNKLNYKAFSTDFLSEKFYKDIPNNQKDLAKWLVCDAVQMQGLAWYVFDSLEFKKEFIPRKLVNYDVEFENWVTFTSKYQKLVWSGISKHNDELCAIVKFESYHNPVKIENDQMKLKGRSLYYGEMWISLTDKQVEYAIMFEDVIMKLKSSMFPNEKLIDLQREIVFNKKPLQHENVSTK